MRGEEHQSPDLRASPKARFITWLSCVTQDKPFAYSAPWPLSGKRRADSSSPRPVLALGFCDPLTSLLWRLRTLAVIAFLFKPQASLPALRG